MDDSRQLLPFRRKYFRKDPWWFSKPKWPRPKQLLAANQMKIYSERPMSIFKSKWPFFVQNLPFLGFLTFKRQVSNNKKILKSWATPKLVKRSLGTKSQVTDPQSQIQGLRCRIPDPKYLIPKIPKDCKSRSFKIKKI